MTAPERIWGIPPIGGTFMDGMFMVTADDLSAQGWPEYIRADIAAAAIAERDALRAEVADLREAVEVHRAAAKAMMEDHARIGAEQRAEVERLRGALAFYTHGNWQHNYPGGILYGEDGNTLDYGDIARAALGGRANV